MNCWKCKKLGLPVTGGRATRRVQGERQRQQDDQQQGGHHHQDGAELQTDPTGPRLPPLCSGRTWRLQNNPIPSWLIVGAGVEERVVDVNGFHGSVEGRAVVSASAPHRSVRPDAGLTTVRSTKFRPEFCDANVFA